MAHMQEPLWFPSMENGTDLLNEEEYFRIFPRGIGPKPIGFKTEATRESAVVIMNHVNLVEILMDVNHWSSMFSGVVSRASTIDVLSTGVAGNYNGAMQVILAEIQAPPPPHKFQLENATLRGIASTEHGLLWTSHWTIYGTAQLLGAEKGPLDALSKRCQMDILRLKSGYL
ncbi:hypothetical protein RND71_004717 [Anisodus tanguticus]|uniref:START domain-containing protein n=1 Tax=Anisodus tanguticus TaxID=243964 RepID=A0AAE1SQ23_9SOLA|nr:hypothetical protein RND71_004717 [Anisodus tanguticus]